MLDTTACIDFLNGDPKIKHVLKNRNKLFNVSTISVYEVSIGLERTKRKISKKRYQTLYKSWLEFLTSVTIAPLNLKEAEKAAQIYDQLESKGIKIDDNDILIAGIMLSNNITEIVTRNVKHFEKIESIEIIAY